MVPRASVPSQKFVDEVAERGACLTRRDEGAYWAYVTEKQRRQTGCPARELVGELLTRDTSAGAALVLAVTLATGALAQAQPPAPIPETRQTIIEIRVHGNQSVSSNEILTMAGIAVGDRVPPRVVATVEQRLLDSGLFESVDVRTRYLSLTATDEVALVLVVRERAGAGSTNLAARLLGPVYRRMLVFPVLDYTEGDGVTYGGRLAFVDVAGADGRVSVPATWGGRKQIGVELDKSFRSGASRWRTGAALTSSENSHFEIDDERARLWVAGDQQLPARLSAAGRIEWADVTFGRLDDELLSYRVSVEFDTRSTISFPRDAVFVAASYQWLDVGGTRSVVGRPQYELQAYKGLVGQSVLAVRAQFIGADGPLPPYEKPLFGGPTAVRGWRVGASVGDRLATASIEVRMPFTSPFSVGDAGVKVFYDTGTAFDDGQSIRDRRFRQGAGLGLFLKPPFADLGVDVAHNLVGGVRVHVIASLAF